MMTDLISDSVSEPRFQTVLLGAFGASALALIAVGIFGVMGYSVARRTREIGIRTALGAHPAGVAMLVVTETLMTTAIGIACGAALAVPATQLLTRFLFQTSAHDPATFGAAAAVLCVTALVAGYLPARRAAAIDPIVALRTD